MLSLKKVNNLPRKYIRG